MKATVVEHTVWVIDTLCWRCTSNWRFRRWNVRLSSVLRDVCATCLLDWIFETRWFQVRSVLRWSRGVGQSDSFHQSIQVECTELVDRPLDQSVTNALGGWFIDPFQDPSPSHLPRDPITEGASHAKRRTSLFISSISWTKRPYSRYETE